MPISRRGVLTLVGGRATRASVGAFIAARGHEAAQATAQAGSTGAGQGRRGGRPPLPEGVEEIKISSNENPLGPGKAVLDAILGQFPEAGRYPFNSRPGEGTLAETLAGFHKVKPENIVLGAGSQEILKTSVRAFTSPYRPLVTAAPTFENCTNLARRMGHPIHEIKVDSQFRLDLDGMLAVARGAGLVFVNNPNNPTATVLGAKPIADFVERVRRISPDSVILIDEAYHEYVTDPEYATAVPLAMSTPNVFVVRTFSKAYGMAGMRIGYAIGQTDTVRPLARLKMPYNVSVFGIVAAMTAINDPAHIAAERDRNTKVRAFTVKALEDLGCRPTASQGNFLFVDIGRPARELREACAKVGVLVGRDFPPFEHSHARISIGTMAEMQRATAVFRDVLQPALSAVR